MKAEKIFDLLKRAILPCIFVVLASILSVILFWANNANVIGDFSLLAKFLIIYAAAGLLLLALLTLITRKINKSALIACLVLLLFSFFHPLESAIRALIGGFFYWHMLSLVIFLLVVVGALVYIKMSSSTAKTVVNFAAFILATLTLVNVVRIVPGAISMASMSQNNTAIDGAAADINSATDGEYPNVYFLLFDEMCSNRFMDKYFDYDNSAMTDRLENMGFSVSYTSKAEYYRTPIVTTNMVNLDYVYMYENYEDADGLAGYALRTRSAPFFAAFEDNGYTLNFYDEASWYGEESVVDSGSSTSAAATMGGDGIEDILLDNTPLYPFGVKADESASRILELRSIIDYLTNMSNFINGPYLNYSHFVLPHAPFMFDQNGGIVNIGDRSNIQDPRFYLDQYVYTNELILDMTSQIIENDPGAVVVITSDHCFRVINCTSGITIDDSTESDMCDIFAAIYWGENQEKLDIEGLHSINLMRTLLNAVFDMSYEMIPYISMLDV